MVRWLGSIEECALAMAVVKRLRWWASRMASGSVRDEVSQAGFKATPESCSIL